MGSRGKTGLALEPRKKGAHALPREIEVIAILCYQLGWTHRKVSDFSSLNLMSDLDQTGLTVNDLLRLSGMNIHRVQVSRLMKRWRQANGGPLDLKPLPGLTPEDEAALEERYASDPVLRSFDTIARANRERLGKNGVQPILSKEVAP